MGIAPPWAAGHSGGTADLSSEIRPKLSQMCVRVRDVRPRACSGPGVGAGPGAVAGPGAKAPAKGPPCSGLGCGCVCEMLLLLLC